MTPGTVNKQRWDRVAELFDRATLLPEHERGRFLADVCAGEPELHEELRGLLAAHSQPGPMDELRRQLAADVDVAMPGAPQHYTQIGPYRVRERLGYGGMGVVYLAEREGESFQQRVAIKVLRAGPESRGLVPRFLAERRILARLEHPNISRFVDGGLTADGAPYFAMEYVEGLPLDQYADRNRLSIEQRINLFAAVCDAIHYAHQHLVVHRDLKPTNILVTRAGVVKVLDFGIAKLLDAPDDALLTGAGQRWMTPDYASPEQVRGETVSTAADVFVLGIVLYELLVGKRPHGGAVRHEVEQSILETEPEKPSEAACEETCQARGLAAARCRRRLAGDLDTIILKALHKAPERRYGTAGELADDVRRHLAGLPVRARPDTAAYRIRKFVARQRLLAAALAFAALSVVAGVVATSGAVRRARANAARAAAERDRAEQVSRFVTGLFAGVDPMRTAGSDVTARELLDSGAARLHRELLDQPASRAPLLEVLARSYAGLGAYEAAQAAVTEAVGLRHVAEPPDTLALAGALGDLARMYVVRGVADSAAAPAREALALRRAVSGPGAAIASELGVLGDVFSARGELDSAEFYLRAAAQPGAEASLAERADVLDNLAAVLTHRGGRLAEVESLQVEALDLRRRQLPPQPGEIALALTGLGGTRFRMGLTAQARADVEAGLALQERALGTRHPVRGLHLARAGPGDGSTGRPGRGRDGVPALGRAQGGPAGSDRPDLAGPHPGGAGRGAHQARQLPRRRLGAHPLAADPPRCAGRWSRRGGAGLELPGRALPRHGTGAGGGSAPPKVARRAARQAATAAPRCARGRSGARRDAGGPGPLRRGGCHRIVGAAGVGLVVARFAGRIRPRAAGRGGAVEVASALLNGRAPAAQRSRK